MNFTKLSLKRPVSVFIVMLALVIFGIMSITTSPVELIPPMEMPMMIVATIYPGAGPEDVESLVTREIEDAVSTLGGIKNVQSVSQENMSMVILELEYGTNMSTAHMDLQEKLNNQKNSLPETATTPMIIEMDINSIPTVTLSANATGDVNLLYFINEEVVPEFEKLSGVASVDVYGGREDYISVQLMEDRMRQYGMDMSSIVSIVTNADFSIPAGTADMGSQSLNVRSGVSYDTVEALKSIPLTLRSGNTIRLSDVATIKLSTKEADSISRYNGDENVSLGIKKRQSASTLDVSNAVMREMEQINAREIGVQLDVVSDSSVMIMDSVSTVVSTLLLGILLSMVVLFLFFGDIKASLIVGSSMPVSLLVTFILMKGMGFSLNLVSLGGLLIGVGMMVDNSIVVIESCFRRASGVKQDFKTCALEGAKFVTSSIIASTITTIVVFLPISTMQGMSGQMFKQLGFTIVFSLTASLLCALTLVPLLFSLLKPRERREAPISKLVQRAEIAYGNLMQKLMRYKKSVVLTAVALLVLSGVLFAQLNFELMPSMDEGTIALSVETRPGLQLAKTDEILTQLETLVASHPDVERYSLTGGGGGMSMGGGGGTSVTAYLKGDREMSTVEVIEQWRDATRDMLDCEINISSASSGLGSMGGSGNVEINLQGNDFDLLKATSAQVEALVMENKDIVRVSSNVSKGTPQAQVMVDPLLAAAAGFTPMQIASNIHTVLSGKETVNLRQNGQEYAIWVEYPRDRYQSVSDLSGLVLVAPSGKQVPLMDVAKIEFNDSPQSITRKNNQYIVTITGEPRESAKFTAKEQVLAAMNQMELPAGVTLMTGSMDEQMMAEFSALGLAILTAVLLVFMAMAMQFESPKFSAMVMICIPFSLIGSFGLMYLTNSTISMPSLMGFLLLVGTVVNNGILFVDTTNQYRDSMDLETALVMAGRTRLRPILMTTLTTVLSMMPMSLGIGSGSEMMQGMAVVIIGGLCASTVLTLLLLPTFYLMFEGKHRKPKKMQTLQVTEEPVFTELDYE